MKFEPIAGAGAMEEAANDSAAAEMTERWVAALRQVATQFRLPQSMQAARLSAAWDAATEPRDRIANLAGRMGLRVKFDGATALDGELSPWRLPMIVQLRDGQVGVLTGASEGGEASFLMGGPGELPTTVQLAELRQAAEMVVLARPARGMPDARVDAYVEPFEPRWLSKLAFQERRAYVPVLAASLLVHLLGLTGVLFSMQVYDRVVPAESFPTLYVLFAGVLLAIGFDFVLRQLRTGVIDLLGKRADLRISDRVFGHALRVRNRARPVSTGSFTAQLRDLDQVRELMTSSTVAAIADLPFFFLFLVIFWFIGGTLVLVPLVALVLLVIPAVLAQPKLRAYAVEAAREASLRSGMLVEVVQGLEDVKTLQAEERFQQQWNHLNAVTGEAQLRLRGLTARLVSWTQTVQMGVYAAVIFFGAPLVMAGDLTTGALVGASMLGSRMMTPLAQVTQVLSRLQQARTSVGGLNRVMALPVDHPNRESRVHLAHIAGDLAVRDAVFRYGDPQSPAALTVSRLQISAGEKIAILGRNGAGKSTLLQALSGLLEPVSGEVLIDDVALGQVDPADVRRDISLLSQRARLFHGTIRDNLLMGAPHATDEDIRSVLATVGADEFVRRLPRGLEHLIFEGGSGLSGGQVQALLLARLLIRNPSVILLDEPTASMDEATERNFIARFREWSAARTVVIATHRTRALELVDRLIVVEGGRIVADGPRDEVLERLRAPRPPAKVVPVRKDRI
ncbi:type I secretion system permease/ATPase [Sphingomonas desiccabilis]|uniref:Type I secretion system permease/ATPase n=1 Tax=Sphingomonas desiccabilis TaxID=429134 RepID=A0A4Q2J173_9SPHN|nr:type I secretion system permease/ATPase [Sphingomonas desiccabilis]MBB3912741.1 ATP-binding cassette subfamily C protein LapB [Sphingomonas desiccabilis]RXZ35568.1 type I secretion system permease/ATPase [Sphingomonas desiccabilis]